MRNVVWLYDTIKGTRPEQLTPQDARQQFAPEDAAKIIARGVGAAQAPTPVGKVVDGTTISGQGGTQILIRIYHPAGAGPFPVIVYFHGRGFVIATVDTYSNQRAACTWARTPSSFRSNTARLRKRPSSSLQRRHRLLSLGEKQQRSLQRYREQGGRGRRECRWQPRGGGGQRRA